MSGKILILGDTHFGARGDSLAFEKFFLKYIERVVVPYIKENKIKYVIQTGDLMDRRKFVNYRTLSAVTDGFIKPIIEAGAELHVIVGNHDTYYRHSNRLNSLKSLFSESIDGFHIYDEFETIDICGSYFDMVPWINAENSSATIECIERSTSRFLIGHLEIAGFEMYSGIPGVGGLNTELFDFYEQVFSGHYHHRSVNKNICYVGSPWDITWSDYNDPRGFHILDVDKGIVEFHQNPFSIHKKIRFHSELDYKNFDFSLYSDSIVKLIIEDRTDKNKLMEFQENLERQNLVDLTIIDADVGVPDDIDIEDCEPEDTMEILYQSARYLYEQRYIGNKQMSKELLMKKIKDIHLEAIESMREGK